MKKIQIYRVKYFAASANTYDVVVNYVNGIEERYPLKNGQTVSIELSDTESYLSIWYHSLGHKTRFQLCDAFLVKAEDKDKNLVFDKSGKGFKAKMVLIEKLSEK